jgi:homocysteine S-methyltransferase
MILDGGLGTELERRGVSVRSSLWSARALLESAAAVEGVHFDYLCAGSDCITTASYQVSFEGFVRSGLTRNDAIRALRSSVDIAKQARHRFVTAPAGIPPWRPQPLIAASVGPYGASLADGSEYHGNYECGLKELTAFHRERIEILVAASPDILACETIPSLAEAEAMLQAVQSFPGIKAWFAFTCQDALHNAHGETLRECVRLLKEEAGVAAIGINCTAPDLVSSLILSLVSELGSDTNLPIVVYPNAGQTWNAQRRAWVGERAIGDLHVLAKEWRECGASWIGGCCGTGPEYISRVRASLK